jgi:hypothetical protein
VHGVPEIATPDCDFRHGAITETVAVAPRPLPLN